LLGDDLLPIGANRALKVGITSVDVFKIHLRNMLLFDWQGNILNDFIISAKDGKFICPELTHNVARDCCTYSTRKRDDPEIMFATDFNIEPYIRFLNGDIVIHNLLSSDALVARKPTIKCDIIDATNALKLQRSDTYYFYRPSMIDYDEHVKYTDMFANEQLEYECECYRMVYKIPSTYDIPTNLTFKFSEYCFGNTWALTWDGNKWVGDSIQGRFQSKVISKCKTRDPKEDNYGSTGCMVAVKRDTLNYRAK
uniref:hypothetical protein n=1 Tax=Bacteroides acidifaciens TaxID=85831 RepID=UPI0025A67C68